MRIDKLSIFGNDFICKTPIIIEEKNDCYKVRLFGKTIQAVKPENVIARLAEHIHSEYYVTFAMNHDTEDKKELKKKKEFNNQFERIVTIDPKGELQ